MEPDDLHAIHDLEVLPKDWGGIGDRLASATVERERPSTIALLRRDPRSKPLPRELLEGPRRRGRVGPFASGSPSGAFIAGRRGPDFAALGVGTEDAWAIASAAERSENEREQRVELGDAEHLKDRRVDVAEDEPASPRPSQSVQRHEMPNAVEPAKSTPSRSTTNSGRPCVATWASYFLMNSTTGAGSSRRQSQNSATRIPSTLWT